MKNISGKLRHLGCLSLLIGVYCFCSQNGVYAQRADNPSATVQTPLTAVLPDEGDLQGFVRLQPACDTWDHHSRLLADGVVLDNDMTQQPTQLLHTGRMSSLFRTLYSSDGAYCLNLTIRIVDTAEAAQQELQDSAVRQAMFRQGTFDNSISIGDRSLCPVDGNSVLLFRAGKIVVDIEGELSNDARNSGNYPQFPHAALEAVAYQIMLRAAQQPELTGVTPQQASVNINGHALPKNALMLGKQVYVPVAEFAKAMGLTSQWNAKTGALTLSRIGHKTVALTAGSTAAKVGGMAAAALKVPVLKQAGQPVMTLDDLLTLTGGRVTGRSGNTVQVKA